jgi:hypothetical protein
VDNELATKPARCIPVTLAPIIKNDTTMIRAIFIFIFLTGSSLIYSQLPGDIFKSKGCEYFNFSNDSIIDFLTIGNYKGALLDYRSGVGIYKIDQSNLSIQVLDTNRYSGFNVNRISKIDCGEIIKLNAGTVYYKIQNISNDSIRLIGPILLDYKKLNKKRFFRGFLNWPWKWTFGKQHWYDPQERILIKDK